MGWLERLLGRPGPKDTSSVRRIVLQIQGEERRAAEEVAEATVREQAAAQEAKRLREEERQREQEAEYAKLTNTLLSAAKPFLDRVRKSRVVSTTLEVAEMLTSPDREIQVTLNSSSKEGALSRELDPSLSLVSSAWGRWMGHNGILIDEQLRKAEADPELAASISDLSLTMQMTWDRTRHSHYSNNQYETHVTTGYYVTGNFFKLTISEQGGLQVETSSFSTWRLRLEELEQESLVRTLYQIFQRADKSSATLYDSLGSLGGFDSPLSNPTN